MTVPQKKNYYLFLKANNKMDSHCISHNIHKVVKDKDRDKEFYHKSHKSLQSTNDRTFKRSTAFIWDGYPSTDPGLVNILTTVWIRFGHFIIASTQVGECLAIAATIETRDSSKAGRGSIWINRKLLSIRIFDVKKKKEIGNTYIIVIYVFPKSYIIIMNIRWKLDGYTFTVTIFWILKNGI